MPPAVAHSLATLVVILHVTFVLFVAFGGVLVLRRRAVAYLHVPAVAWAIYIEWSGALCPLTPLENRLRAAARLDPYAGDFVARHLLPVLYPDGLTRWMQIVLGVAVLIVNVAVYASLVVKPKRKSPRGHHSRRT